MMVSVIALWSSPASARSWLSHTMYSSAVRLPSVRMRQSLTIRSPSKRPNFTLVLLALMASSMGVPLACGVEDIAGGYETPAPTGELQIERPGVIEAGEAAAQHLALQAHLDRLAQPRGEIEPAPAHRRESVSAPELVPAREPRRQGLQQTLDADPGAGSGQGRDPVGQPGREARDVDADAEHQRLDQATRRFGLRQYPGDLGPIDQQVVGPFAAQAPPGRQDRLQRLGQGDGGEKAGLGRRRRRHAGPQQEGDIEIAGRRRPAAAPAAAALALLARPDERSLRRAAARQLQRLLIGAVDALESVQREERRQLRPAGAHPPKSDAAAACAAEKSGPGRTKNSRIARADTVRMDGTSQPGEASKPSASSSKYITLTIRR